MVRPVAGLAMICASLIIMCLIPAGQSYAEIDPETVVGVWLFDEGEGEIASDSSGNGNDGKIFGTKWVDGKFGKALDFDGEDDYVEVADDPILDGMDELTLTAWVYLRDYSKTGYTGFVDKTAGGGIRSHNIGQNSGNLEFGVVRTDDTKVVLRPSPTRVDEWFHLVGTYDGSVMKMYENGILLGTANQTGKVDDTESVLQFGKWPGAEQGTAACFANGIIDEIAIFSAALTEDEVKTIMTQGLRKTLSLAAIEPLDKLTTTWAGIRIQD